MNTVGTKFSEYQSALSRALEMMDTEIAGSVFVACFCEEGDLLSQWRGYALQGAGYAIGFEALQLPKRRRKSPWYPIEFRPVIYDVEEQFEALDHEVTEFLSFYRATLDYARGLDIFNWQAGLEKALAFNLARIFIHEALRFKTAKFREEREWRAIYSASDITSALFSEDQNHLKHVKFRPSATEIVPYIELDLGPSAQKERWCLPIQEIVCGPRVDSERTEYSLKLLYDRIGFPAPKVRSSEVPLR